jgi:hypothetical protein
LAFLFLVKVSRQRTSKSYDSEPSFQHIFSLMDIDDLMADVLLPIEKRKGIMVAGNPEHFTLK